MDCVALSVTIGRRIVSARCRAGLDKNELAAHLGTSSKHLEHWESGRVRPSSASIRRLAAQLGVSAGYLLGLTSMP